MCVKLCIMALHEVCIDVVIPLSLTFTLVRCRQYLLVMTQLSARWQLLENIADVAC